MDFASFRAWVFGAGAFEGGAFEGGAFDHRADVRMAFEVLRTGPFSACVERFAAAFRAASAGGVLR